MFRKKGVEVISDAEGDDVFRDGSAINVMKRVGLYLDVAPGVSDMVAFAVAFDEAFLDANVA